MPARHGVCGAAEATHPAAPGEKGRCRVVVVVDGRIVNNGAAPGCAAQGGGSSGGTESKAQRGLNAWGAEQNRCGRTRNLEKGRPEGQGSPGRWGFDLGLQWLGEECFDRRPICTERARSLGRPRHERRVGRAPPAMVEGPPGSRGDRVGRTRREFGRDDFEGGPDAIRMGMVRSGPSQLRQRKVAADLRSRDGRVSHVETVSQEAW